MAANAPAPVAPREVLALDLAWLGRCAINGPASLRQAQRICRDQASGLVSHAWLSAAAACTMLDEEDEDETTQALCVLVERPLLDEEQGLGMVRGCLVSLAKIKECVRHLQKTQGRKPSPVIATVAVSAVYTDAPMMERIQRCTQAASLGAHEITVAASATNCGCARWQEMYQEILALQDAAKPARLIVTLPTSELGTLTMLYRAALVAMMAGAVFVQPENTADKAANFVHGICLVRAIREFYAEHGQRVGLSLTGVRLSSDALTWVSIMRSTLGPEWTTSSLLRFSGEGLATDHKVSWAHISS